MKFKAFRSLSSRKISTISIIQPEKVVVDGMKFDSKTEAERYMVLRIRETRKDLF